MRTQICLKSGKDCRQATCQSCSMLFIAAISGCPVCLSPLPSPSTTPRNEENSGRNECHQRNLYFCTSHLLNGRPPTFPPLPSPPLPSFAGENTRTTYFSISSRFLTPTVFLYGAKNEEKRDKLLAVRWIKGSKRKGSDSDSKG